MADEVKPTTEAPEQPKEGGKTYQQEDINRMMAAQAKELTAKLQKEHEEELKKAKSFSADERQKIMEEGAKRAQMTADEQAQAALADREAEINRQKAELEKTISELKAKQALSDTKDALMDAGLPKEFANYLSDVDDDKRSQNISDFKQIYDKAVADGVDAKISGKKTPETGKTSQPTQNASTITQADWDKMNTREQTAFRQSSPENMKLADSFIHY